MTVTNLAKTILANAATYGDRVALQTIDRSVTYPMLREVVVNYALHMRQGGIGRGACVAIDSNHPMITVIVSIACSLLGCSWVHLTPFVSRNPALRVTHFIHDGANNATERRGILRVTPAWSAPPPGQAGRDSTDFPGYAGPDATWMIAQSSGTSGETKFMLMSEGLGWRRIRVGLPFMPRAGMTFTSLFHPLSVPGIFPIMRILLEGGTCVFSRSFDFLLGQGVEVVRGSPNHLLGLVANIAQPRARMPVCVSGGGPARKPLIQRLGQFFDVVTYEFSASEVANVCGNPITDTRDLPDAISVGKVRPQASVQIVTENGEVLPRGTEGMIRVKSQCQVTGYLGASAETARVFWDGWFYSGDLGYLTEQGELFITGRLSDQLNLGGVKINPELIDRIIQAHPGIREGICFAVAQLSGVDQLVAAIAVEDVARSSDIARALRHQLEQTFGQSRTPRDFYLVDALVRNPNGKVVRRDMVEAVRGRQPLAL